MKGSKSSLKDDVIANQPGSSFHRWQGDDGRCAPGVELVGQKDDSSVLDLGHEGRGGPDVEPDHRRCHDDVSSKSRHSLLI